jgi:hypothetical protein
MIHEKFLFNLSRPWSDTFPKASTKGAETPYKRRNDCVSVLTEYFWWKDDINNDHMSVGETKASNNFPTSHYRTRCRWKSNIKMDLTATHFKNIHPTSPKMCCSMPRLSWLHDILILIYTYKHSTSFSVQNVLRNMLLVQNIFSVP